jgi:hypothetical protein
MMMKIVLVFWSQVLTAQRRFGCESKEGKWEVAKDRHPAKSRSLSGWASG